MDDAPDEITEKPTRVRLQLRPDWSGVDATPVQAVNQYAASVGLPSNTGKPDGLYLILGHLSPPILLGEDIAEQIEALDGKRKIDIHGRYFLTRERLTELIAVLNTAARNYDLVAEQKEGAP